MHKGEDVDCKVLFVTMRHLNILKYFSFGIELSYSRLAETSLIVITEMM